MLIDCENCGAPLDIKPGAMITTCAYCRRTLLVGKKLVTSSMRETPAGWTPPPQWTPPPNLPAPSTPLHYHPRRSGRVTPGALAVVGAVVLSALGAIAAVVVGVASRQSGSDAPEKNDDDAPAKPKWDGSTTFTCQSSARISGVKVRATASPAISLGLSCSLTIVDSEIAADELIELGYGRLTVENSTLTTKQAEPFRIGSNGGVRFVNSTLRVLPDDDAAEIVVFAVRGNGGFELDGTTVEVGAPSAASEVVIGLGAGNGDITMRKSKIVAARASAQPKRFVLFRAGGNSATNFVDGEIAVGGWPVVVDDESKLTRVDLGGSKLVDDKGRPAKLR